MASTNNLYKVFKISNQSANFNNPNKYSFQHPFTSIVVGRSGAGKSSITMSNLFLGTPDPANPKTRQSNVADCVLFTGQSNLSDPLYTFLLDKYPDNFEIYTLEEFPNWLSTRKDYYRDLVNNSPSAVSKDALISLMNQTLVVFDDFLNNANLTKQILAFSTYSRKLNCSVSYLSQAYTPIDKLIRDNAKYIILCNSLNNQQLGEVYKLVNVQVNISREAFIDLYKYATNIYNTTSKDPLDAFLVIDLLPECPPEYRFRQGFTRYLKY
jgi:hypothetical protein